MTTDACDHVCMNTPGSYGYTCNSGYNLNTDGRRCTGMLIDCIDQSRHGGGYPGRYQ